MEAAEPSQDAPAGGGTPRPRVSVVLPAKEEEAALGGLLDEVAAALAAWTPFEVVVVDDGSRDRTWAVVQGARDSRPWLRGVRLTRNFGHQAALLAGLVASRGDLVITMDSDGQHPPVVLSALLEAQRRSGASVVQTLRQEGDEGWLKRTTSRLFYRVFSLLADVPVRPGSSDFRLLARPVVAAILRSAGPMPFLRGLIPWLGFPTEHLVYTPLARRGGRPSYTPGRMLRLSLTAILGFSVVPLRLATGLGLFISAGAFVYLVYVLAVYLQGITVTGWASATGLLSLLGGIQLVALGVIGEYVGRAFSHSLGRPRFLVLDQVGVDKAVVDP